ncbi:MAG: hypothetical protein H0X45_05170 [Planctomycetes bacterium]|nr:hypothetical protein [Planctomycetota bacterium]
MTSGHYHFRPDYRQVAEVQPTHTLAELEREVGVYAASPEFARAHGGPILRGILDAVPSAFFVDTAARGMHAIVDARIHRLYPGQFPAVPGWHCDASFRADYQAQPDLDLTPDTSHILCCVSSQPGGVSNTEFIDEAIAMTIADPGSESTLWQQVHREIQSRTRRSTTIGDGRLILFSSWTLHRPTRARIRGWRMFFRLSMHHRPPLGDGGLISKQEMVYVVDESLGW